MADNKQAIEQLAKAVEDTLETGEMSRADPDAAARLRLSPRHEIRIEAKVDPIVEETRIYRRFAAEIDDRYEKYLRKADGKQPKKE
ncbi:MAG TPA: hypothetical protein VF260_02575 [Bacilli bacterium]